MVEAPPGASTIGRSPPVTDTPLLEIRGLSKTFGSVQALTEVDFEVRVGEVMALVGDNGAGKSTLIKCVAGIHPTDSGDVFFGGAKVSITKANYTRLFKDKFLKRSDVCSGQYKQYCK